MPGPATPEPDTPQQPAASTSDTPQSDTPRPDTSKPDTSKPARGRGDRKRRRAIRAHAAQAGVAYSVAARRLALGPGETLASLGRTVYPAGVPGRWTVEARERRPADVKLRDARQAARLAGGRAGHLMERFPAGEGPAGPCYAGEADLLAMLYLVVAREAPGLVPPPLDLAWTAELGEETAIDMECAELDRAARLVLADGAAGLWGRVEDGLRAGQGHADPALRHDADRLALVCRRYMTPVEGADGEPYVLRAPWDGTGQVLDALLVVADDGHAPGTRVRLAGTGTTGTIVGAGWGASGPPRRYDILVDAEGTGRTVRPEELVVLPGQEADAAALHV
jgi:hypothetical protein